MDCVFCAAELRLDHARVAYDPWQGRLWRVCPACARWNVVPLEQRWEELETYERAVRDRGRSLLRTEHLDLVEIGRSEVIRVGRAPRPELAGWRYGDAVPSIGRRPFGAWLRSLLLGVPSSPFGYSAGHGDLFGARLAAERWFASPFVEDAPTLTAAFLHVPLAPECPACARPLALEPWSFQAVRLTAGAAGPAAVGECGLCGQEVAVAARDARAGLRLGLAVVNRRLRSGPLVESAARSVDEAAGPEGLLTVLSRRELAVGELSVIDRLALGMALDEQAEAELLEAEWREAEELAAIVDGELTEVTGFDVFRGRVIG